MLSDLFSTNYVYLRLIIIQFFWIVIHKELSLRSSLALILHKSFFDKKFFNLQKYVCENYYSNTSSVNSIFSRELNSLYLELRHIFLNASYERNYQ